MSDKHGSRQRGDHCFVRIHPATFVTRTNAGDNLSHVRQRAKSGEWNRAASAVIRSKTGDSEAMTKPAENGRKGGKSAMHTPPVVPPQTWEAAREQLLK